MIDPQKAVVFVESLACQLELRQDRYKDPLYGWCPPCPWFPSAILVDAEKIIACVVDDEPKIVDERGVLWTRPTAWAYQHVCKALQKIRDKHDKVRALLKKNGFGANSPDLEDAVRQALQAFIMERDNAKTAVEQLQQFRDNIETRVQRIEKKTRALVEEHRLCSRASVEEQCLCGGVGCDRCEPQGRE